VEAGFLSFRNALGVILGTNLGTTLDSWIVATVGFKLNILSYSLPVIAISAIGVFFFEKRKKLRNLFAVFFALGVLFLGLNYMKEGALAFVKDFDVSKFSGYGTFVFVIIGFILTTIIQSSSATIAITLTAIYAGVLNFPSAAAIVIGSEVGTTIKILLWGMKGTPDKKRVAAGNFIYNMFTAAMAYIFLHWLIYFIENIARIKDPLIGLVFFQTSINALSMALFIPFLNVFAKWLENKFTPKHSNTNSYASADLPMLPMLVVDAMRAEAENLLKKTLQFNKNILCREKPQTDGWLENIKSFAQTYTDTEEEYQRLKKTEGDLLIYYSKIQESNLQKEETTFLLQYVNAIRQCIYAAKAIKDVEHNLKEFDASVNDILHQQCSDICSEWIEFDNQLNQLLNSSDKHKLLLQLDAALNKESLQEEKIKTKVMFQLKNNQLNEVEASTLMNVHREILSCKKSLLLALESIKTNGSNNS
jgi:phosphate:Na+ symporter